MSISASRLRNHTPGPGIYTVSLHDALPISADDEVQSSPNSDCSRAGKGPRTPGLTKGQVTIGHQNRPEENTCERESPHRLACRLLLHTIMVQLCTEKSSAIARSRHHVIHSS